MDIEKEKEALKHDIKSINNTTAEKISYDIRYRNRIASIKNDKRQEEIENIYVEELKKNGINVKIFKSNPEDLEYILLCSRNGVECTIKYVFRYDSNYRIKAILTFITTAVLSSMIFGIARNLDISNVYETIQSNNENNEYINESKNNDLEDLDGSDMSEQKNTYCDSFYRMLFPLNDNDKILINTDDVKYNLTIDFTTNEELGDKMDFSKGNTVTITHDTADEIHDVDWFVTNYWQNNEVLTHAIAEEIDEIVRIHLAQKWDEAVRGCGTSLNWRGIQIETILQNINNSRDWTPSLRKALIDFLARFIALIDMNKESELTHKTSYDYVGEEPYASGGRHSDPTNLQDEEKLQEYIDDLWNKAQEYENDSNFPTWDEFVKYAKSRRIKEVQKNINSKYENEYLDMDEKKKETENICYQYCIQQIGLEQEYIAGILGQINAISSFDCNYSQDGRFGLFGFSEEQFKALKKYAKKNGDNYYDAKTQMEFFHKNILENTAYKITDTRTYPIEFKNLVFWSAGEAGYWIERWALENKDISKNLEEKIRQYSEIEYKYFEKIKNKNVTSYFSNNDLKCAYNDKCLLYTITKPRVTKAVEKYISTMKSNEKMLESIAKILGEEKQQTREWIDGLGLDIYDQNMVLKVKKEMAQSEDYSKG